MKNKGFTLLEIMVVLAIIGVVLSVSMIDVDKRQSEKAYQNTYKDIAKLLGDAKDEALLRSTTSRIVVSEAAGVYSASIYYSNAPANICNSINVDQLVKTLEIDIPSSFQITGDLGDDICFFRDNSSNGGDFTVSQRDGGTDIGQAVINVIMATGFINVSI